MTKSEAWAFRMECSVEGFWPAELIELGERAHEFFFADLYREVV